MQEFLETIEDDYLRELILYMDRLILDFHPDITRSMRFKIPFYDYHSWFCYLNPVKKYTEVEWVFLDGKKMKDEGGVLQARGRKLVRGIYLSPKKDLDIDLLKNLLADALLVQEEKKK